MKIKGNKYTWNLDDHGFIFIHRNPDVPTDIFQQGERIICKFSDGNVVMSNPMPGDTFDPCTGVAMCIAKRVVGGRGELKRMVDNIKIQG